MCKKIKCTCGKCSKYLETKTFEDGEVELKILGGSLCGNNIMVNKDELIKRLTKKQS